MDSNEEFEFKPLTEGLGFHSKKIDLAKEIKKSKVFSESITHKFAKEIPPMPNLAFEENQTSVSSSVVVPENTIRSPLPRAEKPESNSNSKRDVIDELIESFKKPAKNFTDEKKIAATVFDKISTEEKLNGKKTPWALAPFIVDLMMVMAFFLVGLIIALYVTKVDIIDFVISAKGNTESLLVLPALLFMMVTMYSILTRIFIGGTLGEMVFDMQLGSSKDFNSPLYGLKVLARLFIVSLTGFVTLPLISWIFRSDISGKIVKLHLIKKK